MSVASALPRTGFKFVLTVRDGPDVGASFQLLPPRVTIGRGGENNVALSDPRISRQAAVIEFSPEQIVITDVSGRESLMVNSYSLKESPIKDGDLIRIGETELRFVVEALPLQPMPMPKPMQTQTAITRQPQNLRPVNNPAFDPNPAGFGFPPPGQAAPSGRPAFDPGAEDRAKKIRFYVIVGAAIAIFVYFMNSDDKPKTKEKGLTTTEQMEAEIKKSESAKEAIEKKRFKSEEERTRAREAQRHYMEGFRDYQKGQFARAIRSFETAQAIDPRNEIAGRYKRLAEKQRDEMISILTLEGRRYKEKSMYARCSAAFEKVLDAIPNKQDVKYKAAEAWKNECDVLVDERFK